MNSALFAVVTALILLSSPPAFADDCSAGIAKMTSGNCGYAADRIREITEEFEGFKATAASKRDLEGMSEINRGSGEALRKIKEVKKHSEHCAKDVKLCAKSCSASPDQQKRCESEGDEEKRKAKEEEIASFTEKTDKSIKSAKTGGEGAGGGDKGDKGDQAKKDDKDDKGGGGGGGMPQMPKPPDNQNQQAADRSCGGSSPDPSCPPKDDVCFKDPNSVACLCQAGLGTADVCKRAQTATARNQGGEEGGAAPAGGKSATYANEKSSSEVSNGRARAGGAGYGGGGGARGGGGSKFGGLSGGGFSGGSLADRETLASRASDSPSGGFSGGGGGGYRGGGSGAPSSAHKKSYDRMAARGLAIAQRRLAGVGGEIGSSHGNLFESVSRAYRSKAASLRK